MTPGIIGPEAMRDPRQYITKEQALAAIEKTTNQRDEILISLLWYTGARVSEIINLPINCIDFKESCITIRALKKRSEHYRSVPIPEKLLKKIYSYIMNNGHLGSAYLFTHDGKQPLSRQAAWVIVRDACIAAGATRFGTKNISKRGFGPHPHIFRHGFAMNWIKNGGMTEKLQEILGHAKYETTRSYQRFTPEDIREEYNKVYKEE